jgi:hypothetical protein
MDNTLRDFHNKFLDHIIKFFLNEPIFRIFQILFVFWFYNECYIKKSVDLYQLYMYKISRCYYRFIPDIQLYVIINIDNTQILCMASLESNRMIN